MFDPITTEAQLELITSVLGAKKNDSNITNHIIDFESILNKDYADFAGTETTYNDDGGALKKLQKVLDELKMVAQFPMLFTKSIIAIAGSFSSGKSSFLNTFFRDSEIHLSVDMDPTTAIPTLIFPGKKAKIIAYTPDGRQGEIPVELFNKIDHKLISKLNFNLASIMPYITVEAPFYCNSNLGNICFIDTPGYDAAGNNSKNDRSIANESLMNASAIVWCIPIDSGEIKQNDITYLNDIQLIDENKKIYIICTKSDSKMPEQVQEVMRKIRETLDNEGIIIEGISAINTITGSIIETQFEDEKSSIFDFLSKQNMIKVNTINKCKTLTDQVNTVFDSYKASILEDIEKCSKIKKRIKEKENDFNKQIDIIEKKYSNVIIDFDVDFGEFFDDRTPHNMKNIETAERIKNSLTSTIRLIFPELKCPKCKHKIDNDSPFCSYCGASIFGKTIETKNTVCKCGKKLIEMSTFCPYCGERL